LAESERRLAAIMFTDIAGYTVLTQRDEALSLKLLEEHRALVRPFFPKYGGREVKTIGDAFLVEFASALAAVRCAFDIQQTLHDMSSSRPSEKRLMARIGIHVGDVVQVQQDIYGDAVNIASRIEPLSEPGGICISEQVYAQVRNKFEFPLTPLGPQRLKNIDTPMVVYRVELPWNRQDRTEPSQAPRTRIAVLPFSNISPDSSDEYFADGMTEELINTISHNQKLKVIARTSVGRFRGTSKSVSEIGREIGVGSILEGSVRKAGNKIRVTAQLIDASSEEHLWSDNYDRQLDDVFSIQSEIAESVSKALMVTLLPEDRRIVERKATRNSAAYVRYLKGRTAMRARTESSIREAKACFEEAIAEDSEFAEAYTGLADTLYLLGLYHNLPMSEVRAGGMEAVRNALSLDGGLAEAHTTLAEYLAHDYKFAEAGEEFRRALAINPGYVQARHWYALYLLELGRLEEAGKEIALAEEYDPLSAVIVYNSLTFKARAGSEAEVQREVRKMEQVDPDGYFLYSGLAWIASEKGDFAGAVANETEALKRRPATGALSTSQLGLYYGRLGNREKAREILKTLEELPGGTFGKPFHMALVYAGLGEKDEMFRLLVGAFEEHSLQFRYLRYTNLDPDIRRDARYAALFQRAGLTP